MSRRLSLLLVACVGCGAASESGDSLTYALPSRQTLEVTLAAADGGTAAPGPSPDELGKTAGLAVLTRQTTVWVNALVGGALDTVSSIARTRPAEVGPDGAVWGPFADATSPLAWRLVVSRVGPGKHTFQLQVRLSSGGGGDFQAFLQGVSQGAGPSGPSQGVFSIDLSLAHRLDPVGHPNEGQVVAGWTIAAPGRDVHVQLAGVHDASEPPATGAFDAVVLTDGSGTLTFDAHANLVGSAQTLEVGRVGSQWNTSGAGRADAEVHGGDVGAGGVLSECWNAGSSLVYLRALSAAGGGDAEGDVSACVFGAPVG